MAKTLLMPKATAVWLIDNTGLTFDQVAQFCSLHPLEVQGIADGDVAGGVRGANPVTNGQLTRDEIAKAEADPEYRLVLQVSKVIVPESKKRGPRYTPISRRNERPNAIKWLTRNHPELKDAQIIRLVGTTKTTIEAVREGTHWNNANLTMADPVTLGLCTQIDLDMEVRRANKNAPQPDGEENNTRLLSAEEAMRTVSDSVETADGDSKQHTIDSVFGSSEEEVDADSVFSGLKSLKGDDA